ncbi:four-carbon acid sugar kinase family protein [Lachnospiraceae bacterium 54-53]
MILLLIIADDFTGALDTGVQFAAHGIRTRVVVEPDVDFTAYEAKVLVVDTETRHLPAAEAYDVVARLTERAQCAGVSYIYKKTDSALRGNIGAELAAVLNSSGCRHLPFLPAFPQTGRITRGGVHYVDGVPVTESPFGMDPFDPVKHAVVTDLIAEQCDLPARSFPALTAGDSVPQDEGILVFDAADADDLYRTGLQLLGQGELHIMAGCAGFGAVLPELLCIAAETSRPLPELDPRLLVVCGSVNPITLAQLDRAESAGFTRLRLTPRQKLEPGYWHSDEGRAQLIRIEEILAANPHCIIETNDRGGNQPTADYAAGLGIDRETLRVRIAGSLGSLVGEIFTSPSLGTLLLTGGDTLLQCMSCVGVRELEPLCELENGVVLAGFTYNGCTRHVITKSGGFGQESLLTDLAARIARN